MSVRLSSSPLSVVRAHRELERPGLGGLVLFSGRVRPDRTGDGRVRALDYEVDRPVALRELAALERRARARFGARATGLWHRTGLVKVGEIAVIVGAACPHRTEAFAAARYLIEEVKRAVPIWKEVRVRPVRRPRPRPRPAGGR